MKKHLRPSTKQDDFDHVAANLEFAAEPAHDVAQTSRLDGWRALRRYHDNIHTLPMRERLR